MSKRSKGTSRGIATLVLAPTARRGGRHSSSTARDVVSSLASHVPLPRDRKKGHGVLGRIGGNGHRASKLPVVVEGIGTLIGVAVAGAELVSQLRETRENGNGSSSGSGSGTHASNGSGGARRSAGSSAGSRRSSGAAGTPSTGAKRAPAKKRATPTKATAKRAPAKKRAAAKKATATRTSTAKGGTRRASGTTSKATKKTTTKAVS